MLRQSYGCFWLGGIGVIDRVREFGKLAAGTSYNASAGIRGSGGDRGRAGRYLAAVGGRSMLLASIGGSGGRALAALGVGAIRRIMFVEAAADGRDSFRWRSARICNRDHSHHWSIVRVDAVAI